MGIYQIRGVVYYAVLQNGSKVAINSIKSTDDRLLKSKYLQKFGGENQYTKYCPDHIELITDSDFDISLTDREQLKLDEISKNNNVTSHGWYDVASSGTSHF